MVVQQWTLPQRQAYIRQLQRDQGIYEAQIFFQNQLRIFSVYKVEIGFASYRLANGRTRAAQAEHVATYGVDRDFFSADPDSAPALKVQHEILQRTVEEAGLLDILRAQQQTEPLILDCDGYVVNGNRRLCAMRMLLQEDEAGYVRYSHVQVVFLPRCTERDIKELEGRLQVAPQGRAKYSWVDEAILYKDLYLQNWSEDQILKLYDKKLGEVRELVSMLDEADAYLLARSMEGKYSRVTDKEYAFRQLVKSRKKCGNDEAQKAVITGIAHSIIDDRNTHGRMYEVIPKAHRCIDEICHRLQSELDSTTLPCPNVDRDDSAGLLGAEPSSQYDQVADLIKSAEAEVIRAIVYDCVQERDASDREENDQRYCLRQVQQALTKLQTASNTLTENSDTIGMDEILSQVEQVVRELRVRLNGQDMH